MVRAACCCGQCVLPPLPMPQRVAISEGESARGCVWLTLSGARALSLRDRTPPPHAHTRTHTAYYRGAMGILLLYDVTDEASFNNIRNWMRNIEQHASDNVNKASGQAKHTLTCSPM